MKTIRWNVVLSVATDRAIRRYLAGHGGKKGDLSRFVDEAVQARLLKLTGEGVREPGGTYEAVGADERFLMKLRALPPERVAEVEDFLDFVISRAEDRAITARSMAVSEGLLQAIWDNPDDAAYDRI